jgi:hypothetical protein
MFSSRIRLAHSKPANPPPRIRICFIDFGFVGDAIIKRG